MLVAGELYKAGEKEIKKRRESWRKKVNIAILNYHPELLGWNIVLLVEKSHFDMKR